MDAPKDILLSRELRSLIKEKSHGCTVYGIHATQDGLVLEVVGRDEEFIPIDLDDKLVFLADKNLEFGLLAFESELDRLILREFDIVFDPDYL